MKARIAEVFESIQGEGLYLGERQLFVRFFGCNLSCRFCDTKLDRFSEYEPQELFKEIKLYDHGLHSISFTGGEPLLQAVFLKKILRMTSEAGYKNYLESNGMLWGELKQVIDYVDIIAMDIKLPSSSGMGNLWSFHRRFLEVASQKEVFLKSIITQETAQDEMRQALDLIKEVNKAAVLVLQPNSYEEYEGGLLKEKLENFKNISLEHGVTSCIIPQIHKMVGVK